MYIYIYPGRLWRTCHPTADFTNHNAYNIGGFGQEGLSCLLTGPFGPYPQHPRQGYQNHPTQGMRQPRPSYSRSATPQKRFNLGQSDQQRQRSTSRHRQSSAFRQDESYAKRQGEPLSHNKRQHFPQHHRQVQKPIDAPSALIYSCIIAPWQLLHLGCHHWIPICSSYPEQTFWEPSPPHEDALSQGVLALKEEREDRDSAGGMTLSPLEHVLQYWKCYLFQPVTWCIVLTYLINCIPSRTSKFKIQITIPYEAT